MQYQPIGKCKDLMIYSGIISFVRTLAACFAGKGRSLKDAPFVLLEDAQRRHAGDLRHQIWSNGKIKVFHPWKIKNRKIGL